MVSCRQTVCLQRIPTPWQRLRKSGQMQFEDHHFVYLAALGVVVPRERLDAVRFPNEGVVPALGRCAGLAGGLLPIQHLPPKPPDDPFTIVRLAIPAWEELALTIPNNP